MSHLGLVLLLVLVVAEATTRTSSGVAPPPTREEKATSYFIADNGRSVVSQRQHRLGRHLTFARSALQCYSVDRYVVTFDELADGTPLVSGSVLDATKVLAGGLVVQARRFQRGASGPLVDAMIFDSRNVTGNDFDLALDAERRGNLLIISADNDSSDADDAGQGGEIHLSWDTPVTVHALTFVDVEQGVRVDFSGPTVTLTFMIPAGMGTNGQVLKELLNVAGVTFAKIQLGGSGAVDDVDFSICDEEDQRQEQEEEIPAQPSISPVLFPSVMPAKLMNPSISVSNTIVAGTFNGDASACPGQRSFEGRLGDPITFCLTVTNTGDTLLAALTMVDPVLGVDDFQPLLRPGESVTLTVNRFITQDIATTTVVATGIVVFADQTPIPNIPTPQDADQAQIVLLPPITSANPTIAPTTAATTTLLPPPPLRPPKLPCVEDFVIDFSADVFGTPLLAGQVLNSNENLVFPAHTTFFATRSQATTPEGNRAMIFNAARPTGNDAPDLGLQPQQGNVLIISQDGNRGNPNDNGQGGLIVVKFGDGPVKVLELKVLDFEAGGRVECWDEEGTLLGTVEIPRGQNGDLQTIAVNIKHVVEMHVYVTESGALDDLSIWMPCPKVMDTSTGV